MKLRISGINESQRQDFLNEAQKLLTKHQGPLRLSEVSDKKNKEKVLFLHERTWGEFFLETLILTPQEIEDIQNKALAAIELAFFSLAENLRGQAGKASSNGEKNDATCLGDMVGGIAPENFKVDDDKEMDKDIPLGQCKDYLKWKVLGISEPDSENQVAAPGHAFTFNGLFTVPEGVSISTCPALQVIAHHVVVGSVGAMSFPKVISYSPFKRILKAFATELANWGKTDLPSCFDDRNNKKRAINVVRYAINTEGQLEHIRNLWCIPDDVNRNHSDCLANLPAAVWEDFYVQACQSNKESIVLELYPDCYFCEPMGSNERKPYYSDGNLLGAINAAKKIRTQGREEGQKPASIMFAGLNGDTYKKMSEVMQSPPKRPEFVEDLLSPEKLPQNVRSNFNLENAVRRVPEIRRNINSILNKKNCSENLRQAGSDSEDDA